jgi:serine/threonine protein kinase
MKRLFSFAKRTPPPEVASAAGTAGGSSAARTYPSPEELTKMMQNGMYSFDALIGQGGMAAVYRGRQVNLGRPVAIKILHREHGTDYAYAERFRREAQVLAQMDHPNLVSVYDLGLLGDDYLYYVMELIEGTDLHYLLAQGQMTPVQAVHIATTVCDALEYAHRHGLVHRDIKPANILLANDGRIKVADFGLAKRFDPTVTLLTRTNMAMGTPDYAAPEQYDPQVVIDQRADVYGLGVVLYQMLTGRVPRGAWEPPSVIAGTDPRLDAVIVNALMPDRMKRYGSATEFKQALLGLPPVRPASGTMAALPTPPMTAPGSTRPIAGRVLVLEDDSLLRNLIVRNLKSEAFEVSETADGADTVRFYQEAIALKKPFDVVLMDLTIPLGMGGAKAMELLLEADPQVDAIVSSGNRDDPAMLRYREHGFAEVLPKPYDPADLVRVVKQVVQGRRQRLAQ